MGGPRQRPRLFFAMAFAWSGAFVLGCLGPRSTEDPLEADSVACSKLETEAETAADPTFADVYRRAETDRADRLAQEVARLKDDLRRAEDALVIAESDLSSMHSRADAVSSMAEARIQVDRAMKRAPWRSDMTTSAAKKLDEAERQLAEGHFGAALFFAYRARRVAAEILAEAEQVESSGAARFVNAMKVNLRSGPSTNEAVVAVLTQGTPVFTESRRGAWLLVRVTDGPAGWVHSGLLRSHFDVEPFSGPASADGPIAP